MDNVCYYCEQTFDTKEKLFDHVEIHNKTLDKMTNHAKGNKKVKKHDFPSVNKVNKQEKKKEKKK